MSLFLAGVCAGAVGVLVAALVVVIAAWVWAVENIGIGGF